MPDPHSYDREALRTLLAARTFKRGDFLLVSGKRSRIYFNMKATMMTPEGAAQCARGLLSVLDGLDADYVAGLEMGAVPLLGGIAAASWDAGRPIGAVFVRKAAKAHGNVAEWCLDHYSDKDYANAPAGPLNRPVRVPTDVKFSHVVRGGSWVDSAAACRSAARRGSDKTWFRQDPQRPQSIWWMTDADFVGFRIVRAVEEQPELKDLLPRVNWKSPESK